MIKSLYSFFFLILFSASLYGGEIHEPFIIVAPERSGVCVLEKAVSKIIGKPIHNIWAHDLTNLDLEYALFYTESTDTILQVPSYPMYHLIYTLKQCGYKVLFLMRDPRDQLVSALFFINNHDWQYKSFDRCLPFGALNFSDQISEMITGKRYGISLVEEITGKFLPWLNQSEEFVCTTYFENLVGKRGGGSEDKQFAELKKICQFLEVEKSDEEIKVIAKNLFGKIGEKIFRPEKVGNWQNYFNEQHKEEFKAILGEELIELKYAQDFEW